MSGYHHPFPTTSSEEEDMIETMQQQMMLASTSTTQPLMPYGHQVNATYAVDQPLYDAQQGNFHMPPAWQSFAPVQLPANVAHPSWNPMLSSSTDIHPAYTTSNPGMTTFPSYVDHNHYGLASTEQEPIAGPSHSSPMALLSPQMSVENRPSRAISIASNTSSTFQSHLSVFDDLSQIRSRSVSPNAAEMARWGIRNESDGTWSCAHPGCTSKSRFTRGCDLRKHYKRHTKTLFCTHEECREPSRGFSSKKDLARHMASHDPQIPCEASGCDRLFSRHDNMKDHVRRLHGQASHHHYHHHHD